MDLPKEIIQYVCVFLESHDLCKLQQTCKFLNNLVYEQHAYLSFSKYPAKSSDILRLVSKCRNLKVLDLSGINHLNDNGI